MRGTGARRILPVLLVMIPLILSCSLMDRPPVFRDGCYLGTAKTWLDENENGVWDHPEQPLAGVFLELQDGQSNRNYLFEPASDEHGEFFLSIFPNTCESLERFELVLRATPPPGYRGTTPGEIIIPKEDLLDPDMHDYLFGFVVENSQ